MILYSNYQEKGGGFMDVQNIRYKKLLNYLFSNRKWNTLEEISKQCNIPKSTVTRDLDFLEANLSEDWNLKKDKQHRVLLHRTREGTLESLWKELRRHELHFQILHSILFEEFVTVSQLITKFNISRSTVYRQLEIIQKVIKKSELQLTTSPYHVVGDEKKIRTFLLKYWELADDKTRLEMFDSIDTKLVEFEIYLQQILEKYSVKLSPGAIQRLLIIMKIAEIRMSKGKFIMFHNIDVESIRSTRCYEIASKLFKYQYKEQFHFNKDQELLYITLYLISEEKTNILTQESKYFEDELKMKIDSFLNGLVHYFSSEVGFNLREDKILYFNMYQVRKKILISKQFKIIYGSGRLIQYLKYLENHSLFQMLNEFVFEKSSFTFEEGIKEEHILDIFFHLQAAILRKKRESPIRIALNGDSLSEIDYVYEVLSCHFDYRAKIFRLDDNKRGSTTIFDVIITTTEINVQNIPVLKISSIPTHGEIQEIDDFIENRYFNTNNLGRELICTFSNSVSIVGN